MAQTGCSGDENVIVDSSSSYDVVIRLAPIFPTDRYHEVRRTCKASVACHGNVRIIIRRVPVITRDRGKEQGT